MGSSISALWQNVVGDLKLDDDARQKRPGRVRLAARRAQTAVVVGRGRGLLPDLADTQFDEEDPPDPSTYTGKVKSLHSLGPAGGSDTPREASSPSEQRRTKVRYYFQKVAEPGHVNQSGIRGERRQNAPPAVKAKQATRQQVMKNWVVQKRGDKLEKLQNEAIAADHEDHLLQIEANRRKHDRLEREAGAKGCRGRYDEYLLLGLCLLYFMIAVWSAVMFAELSRREDSSHYDPATQSVFTKTCNVERWKQLLWWRMNYVWTGGTVLLLVGMEILYWFIAPYTPRAALTSFSRRFVRSIVVVVWLLAVIIWAIVGSIWYWEADRGLCGDKQVDHARGLLITQFCWLGLHGLVFFSDADNKYAVRRMWCLAVDINPKLILEAGDKRKGAGDEAMEEEEPEEDDDIDTDSAYEGSSDSRTS